MLKQETILYEFGPFRLNLADMLLLKDEQAVPLTPKAFETLAILVERSGHLVEKEHLLSRLWPDTFVEESTLSQNIYLLRKALGEAPGENRYIETVPRRGYRFVAPVKRLQPTTPNLVLERRTRARIVIEDDRGARQVIERGG